MPSKWSRKIVTLSKSMLVVGFLAFSLNVSAHTSFSISVGPAFYSTPTYYGPPAFRQNIVWVPAHQEYQNWVPGHYVEYISRGHHDRWMDNGFPGQHGWRHF